MVSIGSTLMGYNFCKVLHYGHRNAIYAECITRGAEAEILTVKHA